jgi:hypothetical protein
MANANSITALVTATVCVLSGCAGQRAFVDLDEAVFEFFKRFYHDYFPKLSCRVSFVRQAAKPAAEAHDWLIVLEAIDK